MNQQQLIEQKVKELLIQNCGTPTIGDNGEMTADLDYYIESDAALSTMIEFGEWMQGEWERLRETEEEDDSLTCPSCHGWTQVMAGGDSVECPYCKGEGVVPPPPDPEEVIEKLCNEVVDLQMEVERLKGERDALLKMRVFVEQLAYFVEEDGAPVDGFRFREIAKVLKNIGQSPKPQTDNP